MEKERKKGKKKSRVFLETKFFDSSRINMLQKVWSNALSSTEQIVLLEGSKELEKCRTKVSPDR